MNDLETGPRPARQLPLILPFRRGFDGLAECHLPPSLEVELGAHDGTEIYDVIYPDVIAGGLLTSLGTLVLGAEVVEGLPITELLGGSEPGVLGLVLLLQGRPSLKR